MPRRISDSGHLEGEPFHLDDPGMPPCFRDLGARRSLRIYYANRTRLIRSSDSTSSPARPNQKRIVRLHQRVLVDVYGMRQSPHSGSSHTSGMGRFFLPHFTGTLPPAPPPSLFWLGPLSVVRAKRDTRSADSKSPATSGLVSRSTWGVYSQSGMPMGLAMSALPSG